MTATFTLIASGRYPVGTVLKAYSGKATQVNAEPPSAVYATATVTHTGSDDVAVFTGLEYDTAYWAAADMGSAPFPYWVWTRFRTPPDPAVTITSPVVLTDVTITGTTHLGSEAGSPIASQAYVNTQIGLESVDREEADASVAGVRGRINSDGTVAAVSPADGVDVTRLAAGRYELQVSLGFTPYVQATPFNNSLNLSARVSPTGLTTDIFRVEIIDNTTGSLTDGAFMFRADG